MPPLSEPPPTEPPRGRTGRVVRNRIRQTTGRQGAYGDNILIVDGDLSALKRLEWILAAERYVVRRADSGEVALASVAAQPPDLILIGLNLPSMHAFELCRQLKAGTATAAIPVIFISRSTDVNDRVEGLALGAVDFVAEPFPPEELVARIRTHLELSRCRTNLERQVTLRSAELRDALERLEQERRDGTRAQQALRESEERFVNMVNTAPVLIWVAGPDTLCTFVNTTWLDFTGRTMEQELGFGWSEAVHPQDLERCLSLYRSSFAARKPVTMEYRLRRYDGEYRWVRDVSGPRVEPGGRFAGYIGSCVDITEARRSQEDNVGGARVESLRVVAGGIAHDFMNFMGTILSTAELAEDELGSHSSVKYIRTIRDATERALEIARELMVYAGRDKEHLELFDLSQLVHEMAELLKTVLSKRAVLRTDLPKLPAIWGNTTHIRQVVMNLIINASDAIGDEAGVIQICTSHVPQRHQQGFVRGNARDVDYVMLKVSDTGRGMTDEQRTRIFDPFFTTKERGHGLGLSVVQGIVHSHGGFINVTSAPGRGATFEVLLPAAVCRAACGNG